MFSSRAVDSLLRRLATTSGVGAPEGAMAHALRHSYGLELALRGVPLAVIQQLLGHSDPRTTSIYTAAHASDLTDTLRDAGLL
jgi:site-specific recombinase XerD